MNEHEHENEIVEFVKHGTRAAVIDGKKVRVGGKRVGVLVARREGQAVVFGWSRANINHGDPFDRGQALSMARMRLSTVGIVPSSLIRSATAFQSRCVRYFKDAPILFTLQSAPSPIMKKRPAKPNREHKSLAQWRQECQI